MTGVIVASEGLRYTPAGVAVLDASLAHESQQLEAAGERQVSLEIRVRFAGAMAVKAASLALGARVSVVGFLAPKGRQSKQLVVHVNEFDLIEV